MHESNGLDIIISLVLNEIRPLADDHMELALEIKVGNGRAPNNWRLCMVVYIYCVSRATLQSFC